MTAYIVISAVLAFAIMLTIPRHERLAALRALMSLGRDSEALAR